MQQHHLISIIIPVYNAEKTIVRCLESVLSQEYKYIEIIVVNDGSTDDTEKILLQRYIKNNNIKFINKKNGGVSSARNAGILNASGDYVVFVDSDDYMQSNMCSDMVQLMDKGADLVICGFFVEDIYGERKSIVPPSTLINKILIISQSFEASFFGSLLNVPWNKMFKKSMITYLFNEKKKNGEDIEFVLEYAKNNCKIAFLNRELYVNNVENESSLSRNFKNIFLELKSNHLYIYKYMVDNKIILQDQNFMDYCISQIWTHIGQAIRGKKLKFKEILDLIGIDSNYYEMLKAYPPDKIVNRIVYHTLMCKNRIWLYLVIKTIYWLKTQRDFIIRKVLYFGGKK